MTADPSQFMHRPLPVRFCNWAGNIADFFRLPVAELSEDSLVDAACQKTGLSDWGDDENFRIPLRVILKSYNEDACFTPMGRFIIRQRLIKYLANRLLIQNELKRNPEILQEKIERPIFIVSLPRTGTTLLQRLLSQDNSYRSLLFWEALNPAPPSTPQTHGNDPRVKETENMLNFQNKLMPGFEKIHHMGATEPEECFPLLYNSFMYCGFYVSANAPQYFEWLNDPKQDLTPTYRYHRLQLQLLQYRFPSKRWLLKAPSHMHALKALLTVYPDASIVQIHRDPVQVLGSVCSLQATRWGCLTDRLDLNFIGQTVLRDIGILIKHGQEARDLGNPSSFFDLRYQDLIDNPLGSIKRFYDYFGIKYTVELEKKMIEWIKKNPKHKKGVHHYSLEQFGLTQQLIKDGYKDYYKRFINCPP